VSPQLGKHALSACHPHSPNWQEFRRSVSGSHHHHSHDQDRLYGHRGLCQNNPAREIGSVNLQWLKSSFFSDSHHSTSTRSPPYLPLDQKKKNIVCVPQGAPVVALMRLFHARLIGSQFRVTNCYVQYRASSCTTDGHRRSQSRRAP